MRLHPDRSSPGGALFPPDQIGKGRKKEDVKKDVKEAYVVLRIFFTKDITYLAIQHVESFKKEEKND